MYRRNNIVVAATLVGAMMLSACSGSGSGSGSDSDSGSGATPQQGGSLDIATEFEWTTDPARASNPASWSTTDAVYSRLLYALPNGDVEPGLLEDYEISEDGLTYTLSLRPDMTFHDGTSFDAEAVKINIERVIDPETESESADYFQSVDLIEAVDETTVVITMSEPDAAFLLSGLAGPGSGIVSPAALQEHGDKIAQNPVGAGPYQFVEERPGESLALSGFEDFWDPERPYLDEVTFRYVSDPQARFASLTSDAADVIAAIDPAGIQSAQGDDSIVVSQPSGYGTAFVALNMTAPPFDDPRAREAVCAATDADAINQAVNLGSSSTDLRGPFPADHPFASEEELPGTVEYDPERARDLVEELGGLTVDMTIATIFRPLGEALIAQWKAAGIEVTGESVEASVVLDRADTLDYQAMPYRFQGGIDPDRVIGRYWAPGGSGNAVGYDNPRVTELIAAGRATTDDDERREIYNEISALLVQDMPVCWLWSTDPPQAWGSHVQGIPDAPDGVLYLGHAYVTD